MYDVKIMLLKLIPQRTKWNVTVQATISHSFHVIFMLCPFYRRKRFKKKFKKYIPSRRLSIFFCFLKFERNVVKKVRYIFLIPIHLKKKIYSRVSTRYVENNEDMYKYVCYVMYLVFYILHQNQSAIMLNSTQRSLNLCEKVFL